MEPFLPPGSGITIGRASQAELALGAGSIVRDCVDKPVSEGGLARDFSEQYRKLR